MHEAILAQMGSGLNGAQPEPPSRIVLDLGLPGVDGHEVIVR
jgi:hypothetical protein